MKTSQLDFRELLSFNPQGGVIRFLGQRAYLVDATAQGLQRKEFIDAFGPEMVRTIVTRSAYAHGWRVAETVKTELPEVWAEAKEGKLGPMLCALYGFGEIVSSRRTDGLGDEPLVETVLKDSFEAEQHLMLSGGSDEAVCWRYTAFASGYVSRVQGREVYFIEDSCRAKGDDYCRIKGRYLEQWGDEIKRTCPINRPRMWSPFVLNCAGSCRQRKNASSITSAIWPFCIMSAKKVTAILFPQQCHAEGA